MILNMSFSTEVHLISFDTCIEILLICIEITELPNCLLDIEISCLENSYPALNDVSQKIC